MKPNMEKKMKPKVIKIKPYTGNGLEKEEVGAEGKLTKISLFNDKLIYQINFKHKVKLTMQDHLGEEVIKDSLNYVEETGVKDKAYITDIIKYVKTDYNKDGLAFKIHVVDVASTSVLTTFEVDSESEQCILYNELYDWRFGKDEEI